MKKLLKSIAPKPLIALLVPLIAGWHARSKGIKIKKGCEHIDVIKGCNVIRVSSKHTVYLYDIINYFDYYFSAVVPMHVFGTRLVDYSTPRYHDLIGFDYHPIMFSSFSEPMITTTQYMHFAQLSEGKTVLDLGAYSGLTSINFSLAVGLSGTVIAVDADNQNAECLKRNISNFSRYSANKIQFLEGAVWNNNDGIDFSCEGNMGSSAAGIVGSNRGLVRKVPSFTLSTIAERFNLKHVDFIKCDIEGAEKVIFSDALFFQKFSPRLIIETHVVDGFITTDKCISDLKAHGYTCKVILQEGVSLPLLECLPPAGRA